MTLSSGMALLSSYLHVLDKICCTCKNHGSDKFIRASLVFSRFPMMLVTVSFTIISLVPIFKSRSAHRIVRPLRNNTGRTLPNGKGRDDMNFSAVHVHMR